MLSIWKFPVQVGDFAVDLPIGAKVLTVGVQRGDVVMWVLVDTKAPKIEYKFLAVGTGATIAHDIDELSYVGTFNPEPGLVYHLFLVLQLNPNRAIGPQW